MLQNVILIALGASFIILLISKLGWREWVQTFGPKLISEMFGCSFCLSFWTCYLISIILFIFVNREGFTLLYPFLATPITRILI
jgi:hypothetical protein